VATWSFRDPAGPQLAAEVRAEPLQQAALQRGVDVLVGDGADEGAVGHVRLELVEPGDHARQLVLGEQSRLVQHARVGAGTGDVVGRQPPVEVDGRGQLRQGLGGAVGETAAPEPYVTAVAAHCAAPRSHPTVLHEYAELCMIRQFGKRLNTRNRFPVPLAERRRRVCTHQPHASDTPVTTRHPRPE